MWVDNNLHALFLALALPTGRHAGLEHRITKRNFVPNRFDIVDNEIKRKHIKMNEDDKLFLPTPFNSNYLCRHQDNYWLQAFD